MSKSINYSVSIRSKQDSFGNDIWFYVINNSMEKEAILFSQLYKSESEAMSAGKTVADDLGIRISSVQKPKRDFRLIKGSIDDSKGEGFPEP